jgi:hypothetical protein
MRCAVPHVRVIQAPPRAAQEIRDARGDRRSVTATSHKKICEYSA